MSNYKPRQATTLIILHCSDTYSNMDIGAAEIDRWHRQRGWNGIGYHYVIRRDGKLEDGRPYDVEGAHAAGHNDHSIGICLVGGRSDGDKPTNNFTEEQFTRLEELLKKLYGVYPAARVIGHREVNAAKFCPVFSVDHWLLKRGLGHMRRPRKKELCPTCGQPKPTT